MIGCGLWGRNILRDLIKLGCEVLVVEPDPDNAGAAADAGAASVVGTSDALGAVDGFVVATPATTHRSVIENVAAAGLPIFAEKPFTTTVRDAEALADLCGDRLFIMHVWRYHPGIEELGRIARERSLGDVVGLRTTRTNWTSPRTDVDGIWTLLPHDVSIALELFGALPEAEAALAEMHGDVPVGLVGLLRVAHTDAPRTSGDGSGVRPWLAVDVSTRYTDKRREVRLHCTEGVAVLSGGVSDHILIAHGGAGSGADTMQTEKVPISTESALLRELRAFVDHLGGGPPPRTSAADGVDIVRTVVHLRSLAGIPG
ncbi:MAG: Gfo/Idh/MocA family oxidoreductase [Rhodothermales bacterium]|nr:Gfo/Idh/MocA family oxidoreductase [Rhodothermales bacterium]